MKRSPLGRVRADLDRNFFRWEGETIRGRQEMLAVAVIESARNLPEWDRMVAASAATVSPA